MLPALCFLMLRTLRNRTLVRLRRLRQPKYLLSLLAGTAYLAFLFSYQLAWPRGPRLEWPVPPTPELTSAFEVLFSAGIFLTAVLPWLWPSWGRSAVFDPAEVQFLFPAPIPHRSLLRYRVLRGQPGIFLGVAVSLLFLPGAAIGVRPAFAAVTLWAAYTFLSICRLGTALWKVKLASSRYGAGHVASCFLAAVLLVAAAISWHIRELPAAPASHGDPARALGIWIGALAQGPASWLLAPFRALVRPAFASDLADFAARATPALLILLALYLVVEREDPRVILAPPRLHETGLRSWAGPGAGQSEREAPAAVPRAPFGLGSAGPPAAAILWKNVVAAGRFDWRRLWPAALLAAGVASAAILSPSGRPALAVAVGATGAAFALFLGLFGPLVLRNDFRSDLLCLDALKTYPLRGWQIALGELSAPALLLAAGEWLLILAAAAFLPDPQNRPWSGSERIAGALTAAILLPCFTLLGLLVQNAAALLFPSWIHLGPDSRPGIEAMGQRLIMSAAAVLALIVAGIPAAVIFGAAFFAGRPILSGAALPLAALLAAGVLLAEAAAGVIALGMLFESFDPAAELDQSASS